MISGPVPSTFTSFHGFDLLRRVSRVYSRSHSLQRTRRFMYGVCRAVVWEASLQLDGRPVLVLRTLGIDYHGSVASLGLLMTIKDVRQLGLGQRLNSRSLQY